MIEIAKRAGRAAGKILAPYADVRPERIEVKGGNPIDVVTEVDKACEAAIRAVFAAETPEIPVLGEEGTDARSVVRSGRWWVVDPLDGTTNFVHGFPFYAVSIALCTDGVPELGVVIDGVRGTEYTATRGGGAFRDGKPMRVSSADLGGALCASGFPYDRRTKADLYLADWAKVMPHITCMRRGGAAALDLAMVASGRLDGFWERHLAPWDVLAGVLLIEEAGGIVTAIDGGPLDPVDASLVVGNPVVQRGLLSLLR